MKNKFLIEMKSRGYLNQCTDLEKLSEICNKNSITGYIGFDCTAKSLTCRQFITNNDFKIYAKIWTSSNSFYWRRNNFNW